MAKPIVNFKVSGEYLTEQIRNCCLEMYPRNGYETLLSITPKSHSQIETQTLFQKIIQGEQIFTGANELTLNPGLGLNISNDVLHNFRIAKVKSQDPELMNEFNFFCNQMGLSLTQVEDIYLKTKHSENYGHLQGGWITAQGYFIPVPCQNHEEVFYDLQAQGYTFTSDLNQIEQSWIRISNNAIASFMKDSASKSLSSYVFQLNLTVRQRITLEKIILVRGLLQEGERLELYGFGDVVLEKNRCKFLKRRF